MKRPKNSPETAPGHKKEDQRTGSKKYKKSEMPTTEGPLSEKDEFKEAEERTQRTQFDTPERRPDREENAEKGE